MPNYTEQYQQIFDYLSSPVAPTEPLPTIVFGRKDKLVARKAADVAAAGLASRLIITGGIGKDSGDIKERGFRSEAHYLGMILSAYSIGHNIRLPEIELEGAATNGAQNAEYSLRILQEQGVALDALNTVSHAVSTRRLAAGTEFEAVTKFGVSPTVYRVPTDYRFNPNSEADQKEAVAELRRLAEWPAKNWLLPQDDLPQNLVDFATSVSQ